MWRRLSAIASAEPADGESAELASLIRGNVVAQLLI